MPMRPSEWKSCTLSAFYSMTVELEFWCGSNNSRICERGSSWPRFRPCKRINRFLGRTSGATKKPKGASFQAMESYVLTWFIVFAFDSSDMVIVQCTHSRTLELKSYFCYCYCYLYHFFFCWPLCTNGRHHSGTAHNQKRTKTFREGATQPTRQRTDRPRRIEGWIWRIELVGISLASGGAWRRSAGWCRASPSAAWWPSRSLLPSASSRSPQASSSFLLLTDFTLCVVCVCVCCADGQWWAESGCLRWWNGIRYIGEAGGGLVAGGAGRAVRRWIPPASGDQAHSTADAAGGADWWFAGRREPCTRACVRPRGGGAAALCAMENVSGTRGGQGQGEGVRGAAVVVGVDHRVVVVVKGRCRGLSCGLPRPACTVASGPGGAGARLGPLVFVPPRVLLVGVWWWWLGDLDRIGMDSLLHRSMHGCCCSVWIWVRNARVTGQFISCCYLWWARKEKLNLPVHITARVQWRNF